MCGSSSWQRCVVRSVCYVRMPLDVITGARGRGRRSDHDAAPSARPDTKHGTHRQGRQGQDPRSLQDVQDPEPRSCITSTTRPLGLRRAEGQATGFASAGLPAWRCRFTSGTRLRSCSSCSLSSSSTSRIPTRFAVKTCTSPSSSRSPSMRRVDHRPAHHDEGRRSRSWLHRTPSVSACTVTLPAASSTATRSPVVSASPTRGTSCIQPPCLSRRQGVSSPTSTRRS